MVVLQMSSLGERVSIWDSKTIWKLGKVYMELSACESKTIWKKYSIEKVKN